MCGRYAIFAAPHRLIELFGSESIPNFPARYNAAPLQDLPIIVKNRIGIARWGLLPPWATEDDKGLCAKMINARSETVMEKPAFRESWGRGRRCLVPVNGFYEWQGEGDHKQAYYIHHERHDVIALAGLWAKQADLLTFTILTKEADGLIKSIHHRMPVILTPAQAQDWFLADESQARTMIAQAQGVDMRARAVGREVGKVVHDHQGLLQEVPKTASPSRLL